jgi:hypothetical protein
MKLKKTGTVVTPKADKAKTPTAAPVNAVPAAPAEPKAKATPKERTASKFVSADVVDGRRMRVSEYQDYTFSVNDAKGRQLTDEELAADWRKQFPQAVAFTAFHVSGARRDYNKGIHSKAFPGPHTSKAWFATADGKRTQDAPKASAKQETPAAPAAPEPKAEKTKGRKKAA